MAHILVYAPVRDVLVFYPGPNRPPQQKPESALEYQHRHVYFLIIPDVAQALASGPVAFIERALDNKNP